MLKIGYFVVFNSNRLEKKSLKSINYIVQLFDQMLRRNLKRFSEYFNKILIIKLNNMTQAFFKLA